MLRIVPHTVPRVGRSYEHFPDGFELHLLPEDGTGSIHIMRNRSRRALGPLGSLNSNHRRTPEPVLLMRKKREKKRPQAKFACLLKKKFKFHDSRKQGTVAACALQSVTRLLAVTVDRPKTGNGKRTRLSYRFLRVLISPNNTSPFRKKDPQKSTAFRSLGSSPPVLPR